MDNPLYKYLNDRVTSTKNKTIFTAIEIYWLERYGRELSNLSTIGLANNKNAIVAIVLDLSELDQPVGVVTVKNLSNSSFSLGVWSVGTGGKVDKESIDLQNILFNRR